MRDVAKVFVLALLAGALVFGTLPAYGADASTTYTTKMKFYDNVKASYSYNYSNGDVWTSSADIPIGGATNGSGSDFSQIYCIDPFVPYHSMADKTEWIGPTATDYEGNTWGATTTDTKGNYVAVAPWEMSGDMQKNADLVSWLVLNGYRGDFRGGQAGSESQASVKRLNDLYSAEIKAAIGGDGVINKTMALMATKIAIWKAVTDDGQGNSVQVTGTSLDSNPAARAKLDKLVDFLVRDAKAGRVVGGVTPAAKLNLHLDESNLDSINNHHNGYYYYGPLTAVADGDGISGISKVFLTASGQLSRTAGAEFVTTNGTTTDPGTLLDKDALFGADQSVKDTQFVGGHVTGSTWTSDEFYLRVPENARGALDLDQLTIKAMTQAPGVPVTEGTPVFLVNEDPKTGIQDWNKVQAFAGAAEQNMKIDLYAEDSLTTHGTLGQLYVQKKVENETPLDAGKQFTFKIMYQHHTANDPGSPDIANATVLNLTDHPVNAASSVDLTNNTFTLKNGDLAMVDSLPIEDYYYWVVEVGNTPGYTKGFEIPIAATPVSRQTITTPGDGVAGPFQLDDTNELGMVTFYNTKATRAYLQVAKYAMDVDGDGYSPGGALAKEFNFRLEYSKDKGATWAAYPLSADNFVSKGGSSADGGGSITNGSKGEFTLHTLEQAFVEVDPGYQYRVVELDPGTGWWSSLGITGQDNKGAWTIPTAAVNAPIWIGPGDRESDVITAEDMGNYLFTYANYGGNSYDLTLSKTVAGDAATAADRAKLFPFTLSHKIPADPQSGAPEIMEPVMLSAKGGWVTLGKLGEFMSWKVSIKGADGAMLSQAEVAGRIKSSDIDMSWYQPSWGKQSMPVVLELKHGEVATVHSLFDGQYEVREIRDGKEADRYTTTYTRTKGQAVTNGTGDTVELPFDGATRVDYTNTVKTTGSNKKKKTKKTATALLATGDTSALETSSIIGLGLMAGAVVAFTLRQRYRRING
ncbi:MAG: Cys-Gln thioester bond-forming surface protein [Coriobacteriia bacterium]|nr:Cys-Gln thioester bond-forming surface protein [Coriobacteriia bacterium]